MAADHFTPQSAVDPPADNTNAVLPTAAMLHVTHARTLRHISASFVIVAVFAFL